MMTIKPIALHPDGQPYAHTHRSCVVARGDSESGCATDGCRVPPSGDRIAMGESSSDSVMWQETNCTQKYAYVSTHNHSN